MKNIATLKYLLFVFVLALSKVGAADSHQAKALEAVPLPSPPGTEPQKIMIGKIEDVVLVPWTVTLPARIDTGASMSSLDARNISVRNNTAEFTLGKEYGGLRLQLPVIEWSQIRTSMGTEKRPVVEIRMCLGPKLIRTLATLRDRSEMTYPLLVGRNVLNGRFIVDTSRSKAAPPACPLLKATENASITHDYIAPSKVVSE